MLLVFLLRQIIRIGRLTLIDANGRTHVIEGARPGFTAAIRLHDKALHRKMAMNPRLATGEAYMDGTLTIEEGTLLDFLNLMMENIEQTPRSGLRYFTHGLDYWFRIFQQYNPIGRARTNVEHHYDLSGVLYDLFLDVDRQYSCAYFADPSDSLERAQANKKRHLAAKLLLSPGQKVLDIGSGWGGLALYLAQEASVDVTGLTLSTEQMKLATTRAQKAGIADRARFHLQDYRLEKNRYDRIVSVGMFEHVGVLHYQEYFDKVAELLTDDGVAVIHSIGRRDGPSATNPWIRKYIFPGGYIPALSEVMAPIERAGLWVTDVEVLRLHYAETLRHWRERFMANWDRVRAIYDERFCRMWEFYLAGSEASFRVQDMMVFQLQLSKRIDAVPLTRDYIGAWEAAHPVDPAIDDSDAETADPRYPQVRAEK
ncbi:MAG TPA: cyclopropane-fatty-acyl-phospholipid synthase family protein [Stellaceae bacterium]|nr:cyclopropane-fatty-acyl-phospholipid synthase family protein [Stellaceae bacterium]